MNIFAIAGLACGISCTLLALLALIFGRTKIHRILVFFNIAVAIWGFGLFIVGIADNETVGIFGWKFAHIGGMFVSILFFHLVCVFCNVRRIALFAFGYLQAVIFNIISWGFDKLITKTRFVYGLYYNDTTFLFSLAALSYLILVSVSFWELLKFFKKSKGIKRTQTSYIIFGFLIGFIGGTSTFLPEFRIDLFYPLGAFGVVTYSIIVTYAVIRYRIINVDEAVALTIAFTVICIPIIAIPFVIAYMTDFWWFSLILSTILAPTALYLYSRAKRRVLTERLAFQEAVTSIAEDIKHVRTLDELVKILANQILKRLKLSYVGLYLSNQGSGQYALKASETHKSYKDALGDEHLLTKDEAVIKLLMKEKEPILRDEISLRFYNTDPGTAKEAELEMQSIGAALTMPIFYEQNGDQILMAVVAMGERLSYKPYGDSEIRTLKSLSNHIALAIKNAEYIEETKRIHAQLLQAQKRQQQSDHMLSLAYMVTNLSHELRNPLNIIKGAAINTLDSIEFELKDLPPGEKYEKLFSYIKGSLADIEHTTTKSTDMLNAILNTLRIDKDKFTDLDIKEVINDSIKRASIEIKGTKIKLKNNIPDGFTKVNGDHTTLELMSFNLIHNAVQAMLRSNKGDKVELIAKDLPDRVQIQFSDNGPGIAQKDIDRIFEPFYTTKGNLFKYETGQSKGVGLGLMIVYQVVTAHGGIIYVRSKEGEGSSFFVELPKKGGTLHGEEQKAIDSR